MEISVKVSPGFMSCQKAIKKAQFHSQNTLTIDIALTSKEQKLKFVLQPDFSPKVEL